MENEIPTKMLQPHPRLSGTWTEAEKIRVP